MQTETLIPKKPQGQFSANFLVKNKWVLRGLFRSGLFALISFMFANILNYPTNSIFISFSIHIYTRTMRDTAALLLHFPYIERG